VHSEYYRLPNDVVQIARISKLFLAVEQGKLVDFAGKRLDEICIQADEEVIASDVEEVIASDVEDEESDSEVQAKGKSRLRKKDRMTIVVHLMVKITKATVLCLRLKR